MTPPSTGALRTFARIALVAGAAASIAFMLQAGRRQRSALLILLFTGWVLAPFLALAVANVRAHRWQPRSRTVLHATMVAVSLLSVVIYGMNALAPLGKAGFIFLVVPAGGWLLIAMMLAVAAVLRR